MSGSGDSGLRFSVLHYMEYMGGDRNSRCIYEGEAVLHAGHIILCGQSTGPRDQINLFAMCLQTTAMNSDPHEIKGVLVADDVNKNQARVSSITCTCKAGQGGRCKHISAALLWCTSRDNLHEIELISQTDIKCVWSQQKHSTKEKYKAVPVLEIPCLDNYKPTSYQVDVGKLRKLYADELPNGARNMHKVGRNNLEEEEAQLQSEPEKNSRLSCFLLSHMSESALMKLLSAEEVTIRDCCNQKMKEIFDESDVKKYISISQHSQMWLGARKYRMTGSRCYEIYTYKNNNNWMKKSLSFFFPLPVKNKYVSHGLKYEGDARSKFIQTTKTDVRDFGLIIPEGNLWLGYSPDGIIFENDKPVALLEIKCLFEGATCNINEAIKTSKFVQKVNGEFQLKKKHKYYGQINLGMSILNLSSCYLAIYSSFDDSIIIIKVRHDFEFSKEMLQTLKKKYFQNMIHTLCINK